MKNILKCIFQFLIHGLSNGATANRISSKPILFLFVDCLKTNYSFLDQVLMISYSFNLSDDYAQFMHHAVKRGKKFHYNGEK